jgi:hypothetical protein
MSLLPNSAITEERCRMRISPNVMEFPSNFQNIAGICCNLCASGTRHTQPCRRWGQHGYIGQGSSWTGERPPDRKVEIYPAVTMGRETINLK